MRKAVFVLVALFLAAVCSAQTAAPPVKQVKAATAAGKATNVASVKKAIETANATFLAALKKGDATACVSGYTEDAVVMMPGEPAWKGREAIANGFKAFLAQVTITDGGLMTTDVMLAGDLAVETGTYEWTIQPKSGPAVKDTGKYLTAWKHQADGGWRIIRDISNSDIPPKM